MANSNLIIELFESLCNCLAMLIDTDFGGWVCGILVILGIVRFITSLKNI